jgi:nucleotide-binding universal stress UspA family protein
VPRWVIVHVAETDGAVTNSLDQLAEQLSRHDISAQISLIRNPLAHVEGVLETIASEFKASLLVVAGYGDGPCREAGFRGVTKTLISHAQCPVFAMH